MKVTRSRSRTPAVIDLTDEVPATTDSSAAPVTKKSTTAFMSNSRTTSFSFNDTSPKEIRQYPSGGLLPGLSKSDLRILRKKQARLRETHLSIAKAFEAQSPPLQNALYSTLIFVQYEAGTAVCIDPAGWLLTCAHVFGEDDAEIRANMPGIRWLLFYDGLTVQTECRAYDTHRDLALLKIVALEVNAMMHTNLNSFAHIPLTTSTRVLRVPILCTGQPGADDLESETAQKTTYNLFEVSEGMLRGLVRGTDPQNNLEIGALKHDAWTYWGHSGAPLVKRDDGSLVGLHSSWDDRTRMRHGIPLVALKEFLRQQGLLLGVEAAPKDDRG